MKILLLDEENYEKCDHETPKKKTQTKKRIKVKRKCETVPVCSVI